MGSYGLLAGFTWGNRPAASSVPAGTRIRTTDVGVAPGIVVQSDGANWIPYGAQCLGRGSSAVIIPSSGTSNASGQITHTTALPAQPVGTVLVFLPAGVVTAGSQGTGAGLYSATYSSTTVCQLTGSGIVTANAAYTQTTGEVVLATTTVPGGAMGATGGVREYVMTTQPNNANAKTFRVKLAGTQVNSTSLASIVAMSGIITTRNRGSSSAQITNGGGGASGTGNANTPTSIDTSPDVALTLTGQLGVATDFLILESQETWLLP